METVDLMNFAQALEAMKAGKAVKRFDWLVGDFVFMQVPSNIPIDIVPKMQSLPKEVKDIFVERSKGMTGIDHIEYDAQFAFVNCDNQILGWTPLPCDVLAEDWYCLID